MIKPAVVEPCKCELPRCSICSGLNPLTAFIHVCIIGFCFFGWYTSMKAGVKGGAFNMMPAFKNFLYATGYLVFLLLCEFITLRNLKAVEKATVDDAKSI